MTFPIVLNPAAFGEAAFIIRTENLLCRIRSRRQRPLGSGNFCTDRTGSAVLDLSTLLFVPLALLESA